MTSPLRELLENAKFVGHLGDDSQESIDDAIERSTRDQLEALVKLCEELVARVEQLEGAVDGRR